MAALRSGEEDLAVLERKTSENPDDVVAQLQLAGALSRADRFEEAVAAYDRALALNPDLEAAHLGRFRIFAGGLNDPAKALEAATQARRAAPSSAAALAALGRAQFLNRNYDLAYGLLADATSGSAADGALVADFAWTAYSLGRVEEARTNMARAVAAGLGDRQEEADTFLALTAPDRLENPGTKALAEATLTRNPDHVPALMLTAALADQTGEPAVAIEAYQKVLTISPGFDPARIALARHYLEDPAKLDEAEALANEARRRLTDDPELTRILATVSFRKKNHAAAVQLLRELATRRPLTGPELFALGTSQAATGRNDDARQSLEKAIEAGLGEAELAEAEAALAKLDEDSE